MRIAYIVESYGQVSETFITQLVAGLAALGSSLRVLVDSILSGIELPPRSVQIEETGYCDRWRAIRVWLGRMGRVLGLRDLDAWLARAVARRSLFPAIRRFQPDVAYVEYGFNAILARQALMEAGVPFVVHFHGLDASAKLARNEYRAEIRKVFEDAQAVIVASRHILRRLILAGCPQTKIRIVRHEVSLANLPVIRWEERKKAPPSVIHIGRLVEKKSPLSLLYAFAIARRQVPTATLTVIGEGPLRRAVSETIGLLGLEGCVRVRGAQPHRRVIEELQSHWVYAQHSVTASDGDQEGFSMSMLEAAAAGLPVVSTLHDGIPENVADGQTGFLVPEYDYEEMATRLIQLLSDPDLAQRMGMAGRRRVEDRCRQPSRPRQIADILQEAAAGNRQAVAFASRRTPEEIIAVK